MRNKLGSKSTRSGKWKETGFATDTTIAHSRISFSSTSHDWLWSWFGRTPIPAIVRRTRKYHGSVMFRSFSLCGPWCYFRTISLDSPYRCFAFAECERGTRRDYRIARCFVLFPCRVYEQFRSNSGCSIVAAQLFSRFFIPFSTNWRRRRHTRRFSKCRSHARAALPSRRQNWQGVTGRHQSRDRQQLHDDSNNRLSSPKATDPRYPLGSVYVTPASQHKSTRSTEATPVTDFMQTWSLRHSQFHGDKRERKRRLVGQ